MKNFDFELRSLCVLLSSDFRGTSLNKELEKFFLKEIIPTLKEAKELIKPTLEDLGNNPLLLYLIVKKIPLSTDLLLHVTSRFFKEVEYRSGVCSYVQKTLGNYSEEDFVSMLIEQTKRLKHSLSPKEIKEFLFSLYTLKEGEGTIYILKKFLSDKDFFNLNTLIDLALLHKNERCSFSPHSIIFSKLKKSLKEIDKDSVLKEKLISSYFDKNLNTFNTEWFESLVYVLIEKLILSEEQILFIKTCFDKWYIPLGHQIKFCEVVFTNQTSITPSEVKRWLQKYKVQKLEKKVIISGSVRKDHC